MRSREASGACALHLSPLAELLRAPDLLGHFGVYEGFGFRELGLLRLVPPALGGGEEGGWCYLSSSVQVMFQQEHLSEFEVLRKSCFAEDIFQGPPEVLIPLCDDGPLRVVAPKQAQGCRGLASDLRISRFHSHALSWHLPFEPK